MAAELENPAPDAIDFDALLDALAAARGRDVYVEISVPQSLDPPTDYVPAVLRGQLGPIEMSEDTDHHRSAAVLRIGKDGSQIRLDAARFRWGKSHADAVKADFDGIRIGIVW